MSACYECGGEGFKHGCIDDMCRSSYEAEDCPNRRWCSVCKGEGELYSDWDDDPDMEEK